MKRTYRKSILREVRTTLSRFLAILLIVALGVGFLAGLLATTPDMRQSTDAYYDETNLMDIRVVSTLGLTAADLEAVVDAPGIERAELAYTADALFETPYSDATVTRVHSLPLDRLEDGATLNRISLAEGRYPREKGECLVLSATLNPVQVGDVVRLSGENQDLGDTFAIDSFTVVGIARSSYYLSIEREPSTVGNGKVGMVLFTGEDSFGLSAYTDLYATVAGAKALNAFAQPYEDLVAETVAELEARADAQAQRRYDEVAGEAEAELDQARTEYAEQKAEAEEQLAEAEQELREGREQIAASDDDLAKAREQIADNEDTLADGQAKLDASRAELVQARQEIADNEEQLAAAQEQLTVSRQQLDDSRAELTAGQQAYDQQAQQAAAELAAAEEKLQATATELAGQRQALEAYQAQLDAQAERIEGIRAMIAQGLPVSDELRQAVADYDQGRADISAGFAQLETGEAQLREAREALAAQRRAGQQKLDAAKAELDAGWAALAEGEAQYEQAQRDFQAGEAALVQAREQLSAGEAELTAAQAQLDSGKRSLAAAKEQLAEGETQLAEAKAELADGEAAYASAKREADEKLADGQRQLDDAQQKIDELEVPEWYVLDRNSNAGYVSFDGNAEKIEAIAKVFPIFFFLVAALVALTTMTRMVEEERTQIGTLKALGYGKGQIALKYLLYAGCASIAGSALGLLVGFQVFPTVIWGAYAIMYDLPGLRISFHTGYALISSGAAVLCTLAATLAACYSVLAESPARLMLPKAPKPGKRVFLEYITPLWSRLKFTHKVTARNLIRYKKRFFMTVIGIAGCTALLVTGFGLRDSIRDIVHKQYGEICTYNLSIGLKEGEEAGEAVQGLLADSQVTAHLYVNQESMTARNGKANQSVTVLVPEEDDRLAEFITLRQRRNGAALSLEPGGALLSEKLSETLGLSVGEAFTLDDGAGQRVEIPVTGITENYLNNYVYLPRGDYARAFGEAGFNTILVKVADPTEADRDRIAACLLASDSVNSASFTSELSDSFDDIIENIDYIVVVLLLSAALLAFIVLYNLININITERQKEIATIKVLGFYDREVAAYVYRETGILSLIGTLLGLLFGVFLHAFVVKTAEVDIVMFGRSISWLSFLLSAALTLLFTLLVSLVMYRKLKRIDMVESMKAGE